MTSKILKKNQNHLRNQSIASNSQFCVANNNLYLLLRGFLKVKFPVKKYSKRGTNLFLFWLLAFILLIYFHLWFQHLQFI
jgi:hypothetical protein